MPETSIQQQLRQKCMQYKQLQQEKEAQLAETQKHLEQTEEQLTQTIKKLHRTEDLHKQTLQQLQTQIQHLQQLLTQAESELTKTQVQLQNSQAEAKQNMKDSYSLGYAKSHEEMGARQLDFARHLKEIQMEIRMMIHLADKPTKFGGDGPESFNSWVRQTERTLLQLGNNEERARVIVLKTLKGPASDFMVRENQNNPNITWKEMKTKLAERYNDTVDMANARQKLRKIKQTPTENVQNYYERFMVDVNSAYTEDQLIGDYIQSELTETFAYGLLNDNMVHCITRKFPKTLEEAFKLAIAEQEAQKAFDLYKGTEKYRACLLYTSPSPRDRQKSRMPSSA